MKKQLIFSAVFGIIAALATALYLGSLEGRYKKGAEMVKVLVATQYIDQGTLLTGSLVEEKMIPKDYVQPKAIAGMKDLIDTESKPRFMTVIPLDRGEQITTTKLSMLGLDTGISAIVPTDRRAVTLTMEGETVSGIVKPGNRVDIIGVFDYEDKNMQKQEGAFTLLQNVLVLAIGDLMLGSAPPTPSGKNNEQSELYHPPEGEGVRVSLSVTPQEAEILTLAAEKGAIRLSLRPTGDNALYVSQGTRIRDICKEMGTTSRTVAIDNLPTASYEYVSEMKRKQREAMEILRKYQRR